MKRKQPVWYVRPGLFLKLIEKLKRDILEGKYDDELRMNAARLIYDAIKDRV